MPRDKAKNLRLKFADRDAQDVASALLNTQEGGLYTEVDPIFLHDSTADKAGIFEALDSMARNMGASASQDLAVVMFAGHGTMIRNQFYLVPNGADSSTPLRLEASAIPATQFQDKILELARHGRVPVLLDACRSAGLNTLPPRGHAEIGAGRRQCDGADLLDGGHGLARGRAVAARRLHQGPARRAVRLWRRRHRS